MVTETDTRTERLNESLLAFKLDIGMSPRDKWMK